MRVNQYEYSEAKEKLRALKKSPFHSKGSLGYALLSDKYKKIIQNYESQNLK